MPTSLILMVEGPGVAEAPAGASVEVHVQDVGKSCDDMC